MTFIPPVFSTLKVNTLNLDTRFSTLLGRYKINDQSKARASSSSEKAPNSLELLMARTQEVISCKTDRKTARDVFNQLVNELRPLSRDGDEQQCNEASLFLLGALLHRYFRLLREYDKFNGYTVFFNTTDVRRCKLFSSIRKALNLSEDLSGDFRARDRVILDETTIVTALEAFKENMLLKDDKLIPRYNTYSHFREDTNFERHLQDMIDDHRAACALVLNQFKAIQFIQCLAIKLELSLKQVDEALTQWQKVFIKEYANFSVLTLGDIEEHITKNIKNSSSKEQILDLLHSPIIKDNLELMDHERFISEMKRSQIAIGSYILFGAYALIMQSKDIKEQLMLCMHKALGVEGKSKSLTDDVLLFGMQFLRKFLDNHVDISLDCSFFGGKEKMSTQLAQKEAELITKIEKKSTSKSSADHASMRGRRRPQHEEETKAQDGTLSFMS